MPKSNFRPGRDLRFWQDQLTARRRKIMERYLAAEKIFRREKVDEPSDDQCRLAIIIPAYSERRFILRPLFSLAKQAKIDFRQFEVIVVVNNPAKGPVRAPGEKAGEYRRRLDFYRQALANNRAVIRLLRRLQGHTNGEKMTMAEKKKADFIRQRGLKVHYLDRATGSRALGPREANVGFVRNLGAIEAMDRFYRQGRDGIIVHTDADTYLPSDYLARLLKIYSRNPRLVGVNGWKAYDVLGPMDELTEKLINFTQVKSRYFYTIKMLAVVRTCKAVGLKKFLNRVTFCGQCMSSRAWALAAIGGFPKVTVGGEDGFFGDSLALLGPVKQVRNLVVYPLDRPSERFIKKSGYGSGHGQKREKLSQALSRGRTITVFSPEWFFLANRRLEELFQLTERRTVTAENLAKIFAFRGGSMVNPGDLAWLCRQLNSIREEQRRCCPSPAWRCLMIREKITNSEAFKKIWPFFVTSGPFQPLPAACRRLAKCLARDKRIKSDATLFINKAASEKKKLVRERREIIRILRTAVVSRDPSRVLPDQLWLRLERERQKRGLDTEELGSWAREHVFREKTFPLLQRTGKADTLSAALRKHFGAGLWRPSLSSVEKETRLMQAWQRALEKKIRNRKRPDISSVLTCLE